MIYSTGQSWCTVYSTLVTTHVQIYMLCATLRQAAATVKPPPPFTYGIWQLTPAKACRGHMFTWDQCAEAFAKQWTLPCNIEKKSNAFSSHCFKFYIFSRYTKHQTLPGCIYTNCFALKTRRGNCLLQRLLSVTCQNQLQTDFSKLNTLATMSVLMVIPQMQLWKHRFFSCSAKAMPPRKANTQ